MTLALAIGALIGLSTLYMVFDIRRRALPLSRWDGAIAILRDQLAEVEADRARGLISDDEARAATLEIERRILGLDEAPPAPPRRAKGTRTMILVAALAAIAALVVYLAIGSPGVESRPFADRGGERADEAEVAGLVAQLVERLESDPEGGPIEGWVLLGQTHMVRGRYAEAAQAFARAAERDGADSSVLSRYAEALIAVENGVVTPRARGVIDRALALDDRNPAAAFFRAQALEQDGALVAARTLLVERLEAAEGFQPWMGVFVSSVNRLGEQTGDAPIKLAAFAPMMSAGPGPTVADVAAADAMTGEDRMAFIRSMVEGLAARLKEEPGDVEGWFRLIRAYEVLGETDALEDARARTRLAVLALPAEDERRADMLAALGPAD